jgi:hypothetical protein
LSKIKDYPPKADYQSINEKFEKEPPPLAEQGA